MNTRNAPNSGIAGYVLILAGFAWISLIIRWGIMLTGSSAVQVSHRRANRHLYLDLLEVSTQDRKQ